MAAQTIQRSALLGLIYNAWLALGAESSLYEIDDEIIARLACQVQGDSHLYDLRELQVDTDYKLSYDSSLELHFNFCTQLNKQDDAYIEDWCLQEDTHTFAYLKDSAQQTCYALTDSTLYPSDTQIENTYAPKELVLQYLSDVECPYTPGTYFTMTYFFQCVEDSGDGETSSEPQFALVDNGDMCEQRVLITDNAGCPVLSMPAFTIFLDQWPWIVAYGMIALGAYMLIFGRKHFPRVARLFITMVIFGTVTCLLSINGHFEKRLDDGGATGVTIFLIILIMLLGLGLGIVVGYFTPQKWALVFLCITNGLLISMLFYTFLMTFTGTWIVLVILSVLMTVLCVYLPLKFDMQMKIQTTSFMGAWMLCRGVSLMVGGYPNELQMFTWMNKGYVLSTSNTFFVYLIATVLLFLIGQRTQRAQYQHEQESNSYRRISDFDQDEGEQTDAPSEGRGGAGQNASTTASNLQLQERPANLTVQA